MGFPKKKQHKQSFSPKCIQENEKDNKICDNSYIGDGSCKGSRGKEEETEKFL